MVITHKFIFMSGKPLFIILVLTVTLTLATSEGPARLLPPGGGPGNYQYLYIAQTGCTMRYREDSNDNIYFSRCSGSTTSTSWSICFPACCGTAVSYPSPTQNAIQYCEDFAGVSDDDDDDDEKGSRNIAGVMVGIFAGVASVIVVIICIRCCCRKKGKTIHNAEDIDDQKTTSNWTGQMINSRPDREIVWSAQAKASRHLRVSYQPCTICLEENTNVELCCGHQFHTKCIGTWLKKSDVCPCCRFEGIKDVRIFCKMCRWRYYIASRPLVATKKGDLPVKCQHCEDLCDPLEDNTLCEMKSEGSDKMIELMGKTMKHKK